MTKVYLHGSIKKYGDVFDFNIGTASEAVAALVVNFPQIEKEIRGESWVIIRGDQDEGFHLDEDAFVGLKIGDADIHIMPEIMGSKKNGFVKAILGVSLIALSFGSAAFLASPISSGLLGATTWGNAIGQIGLVMTLGGVSQMLAGETDDGNDDNQSYTLSGATSGSGQGAPVQIIYGGPVMAGGMMISGGVDINGSYTLEEITPDTNLSEFTFGVEGGAVTDYNLAAANT